MAPEVRGNRYSVPAAVAVRIGLDGLLRIYQAENPSTPPAGQALIASHSLKSRQEGWSTLVEHRTEMWKSTLPQVEQRPLAIYEEVL